MSLWLLCSCGTALHVRVVEQSGIIEPKEVRGKREIKSVVTFLLARILIHLRTSITVHHQQQDKQDNMFRT